MSENNERNNGFALIEEQREADRKARRKATVAKVVIAAVIVALVGVFGVTGMMGGSTAGNGSGTSTAATAVGNTHAVTDTEGRVVQVPVAPKKVAVLDSFAGELAVMLGAGDQVYSIPGGTMSDKILQTIYPGLMGLVQASGSTVNVEDLVAAQVDLVLVKGTLPDTERTKLDNAKIPYVVVSYETLDDQLAALDVVADALGDTARERGAKMHTAFDEMIATVDNHTAAIPQATRLKVYHSINDALLTDAKGSLGASWIERAGAASVSAGEAATSGSDYTATLEAVYSWAPDAIICNVADTADAIRADAKWASLTAVSAGQVYAIPIGATRWGQRGSVETPLAMLWLGCTLYPSVYADVDLKATVTGFYQECLGVSVDDALYDQIISGKGIRTSGNGSGSGSGSGGGSGNGSGSGGGNGSGGGSK